MTFAKYEDLEPTVAVATSGPDQNFATDLYTYSTSEEEYDSSVGAFHNLRVVSPSIEAGNNLVHKLLVQLTLNDSPPSNDNNENQKQNRESNTDPCQLLAPTVSLSDIEMSSIRASSIGGQVSLKQQGHIALAKLCISTLDSLEKKSDRLHQLGNSTNTMQKQHRPNKTNSSSKKQSQSLHWIKRKFKKNSRKASGDNIQKSRSSGFDSREGRDTSESRRKSNQESGRLQLFGSEYARFLSTTPLAPKNVSGQTSMRSFSRGPQKSGIQNIEDADSQVITGPITDITITQGEEKLSKGYYRVSQSPNGEPFFFSDGKSTLFLCVKKERNWDRAAQRPCVTAISIIFPDRKEFVPPGFSLVCSPKPDPSSSTRPPVNLNMGGSEPAYLCFRRSREGNPLTGILPLFPSSRELIPEGYTVLEHTPRNFVASLRTSNVPIFLAYRQRLANLESLRPAPLVKSVLDRKHVTRLESYYCTGGTVVASKVGRFHIMDRSTHSLLSPSSIKHRLALIEMSRRRTLSSFQEHSSVVGDEYLYSDTSLVESAPTNRILSSLHPLLQGLDTSENRTFTSDFDRQSICGDFESIALSSDVDKSFASNSQYSQSSVGVSDEPLPRSTNSSKDKKDLERCTEALGFIPTISSLSTENSPKENAIFRARVSILVPILTSCYTRHGGSAFLSIAGLTDLLRHDFFEDDIEMSRDPSSVTTLLDLSIQVACDVSTMGAQETQLHICVEFVEEAVKYGCGYLSTRTVGYVLRFFLFVFYFGISSPTGNWGVVSASDQYLLEDIRFDATRLALPGGAPQFAILSLKDLIVFMIARLGSQVHFDHCLCRDATINEKNESSCPHFSLIDNLVNNVVDNSVFRVDIANFTELAMHQIMRSGGSELFWYEMINLCGSGLFGNDTVLREETRHMYAICFALLANCVKVASSKVRKNGKFEGLPRDVANKLMSLEMLKFFLEKWERGVDSEDIPNSHSVTSFAFCIRRLVVPCLLANTTDALADPRIFRRLIQVVGVLWCSPFYRKHMKLEIGILFDHFILRLLKLGPQILFRSNDSKDTTYVFAQQLELMKEIKNWFRVDTDRFLELYLNFDTEYGTQEVGGVKDLFPGLQLKLAEQLCSFLCNLSEECTEYLGDKIKESQSSSPTNKSSKTEIKSNQGYQGMSIVTLARESARRLRQAALDAISQIIKMLTMIVSSSLGEEFSSITEAWYYGQKYVVKNRTSEVNNFRPDSALVVGYWQKIGIANNMNNESIYSECKIALDSDVNVSERKKNIDVAYSISREKSLIKAIEYLIACNILTASPREISSFLRIHCENLDPAALGRYLGEGGSDHSETDFWNQIRFNFIRAISFVRMTVEEGLRHLLTKGGFRLPGEAQQIDRLIATFARCYWEDNAGDKDHCPIENEDTIYLLSFAIIMLNTDLHKSNIYSTKSKKKNQLKKMTKDEFSTNLQRANKGVEINKEYLSTIYDGIKANPILLRIGIDNMLYSDGIDSSSNLEKYVDQMTDNVRSLDALLRGLALHEYQYVSLQDYYTEFDGSVEVAKINLTRCFMMKSWHQFHGLINSTLKIAHLDPKAMESCVDLLKFALCLTILLDMPTEQVAFLDQLGRFRLFNAWRSGNSVNDELQSSFHDQQSYKKEKWYIKMKQSSQLGRNNISKRNHNEKFESLVLVDRVVNDMGLNTVSLDTEAVERKLIRDVTRRIENAEFLLNDPTRTFLREGNILKRANRSGRDVEYRFFLFSDILIYAKKIKPLPTESSSSLQSPTRYRIHEELPLILMKVVDWFPPEMRKEESKRAIQFYHPRKLFFVLCSDHKERNSWVTDIRQAIDKELERKVAIETARKAAANVPANGYAMASNAPSIPTQLQKQCIKSLY